MFISCHTGIRSVKYFLFICVFAVVFSRLQAMLAALLDCRYVNYLRLISVHAVEFQDSKCFIEAVLLR